MSDDGQRRQTQSVRDYFDSQAKRWRTIYSEHDLHSTFILDRRERVLAMADKLGLPRGAKVLDLGCGAGTAVVELAKRGFKVTGIDVADAMITQAKETARDAGLADQVRLEVGSAYAIDHPDDSFDLVIATGVIEYLEWDRWAFQEVRRILKPGGCFIVTAPNRYRVAHLARPLALAKSTAKRIYRGRIKKNGVDSSMETDNRGGFQRRMYWPRTLERKLEGVGFELVEAQTHGFGPLPVIERWQMASHALNDALQSLADRHAIPQLHMYGANYNGVFRKTHEPNLVADRSIFRDPVTRDRAFERRMRKAIQSRDQWAGKNLWKQSSLRSIEDEIAPRDPVLVISPHPDDEIIGCGGTLLKLRARGSKLTIVQMTNGSGTRALRDEPTDYRNTIRVQEARIVAKEIGADVVCFEADDSTLAGRMDLAEKLREVIDATSPAAIFTPFINDPHPDHVAANRILIAALKQRPSERRPKILGYEVWSLVPVNVASNIDAEFDRKEKLLLRYRTGMKPADYVRHCMELHAWNARRLSGRKGFDECFFADADFGLGI
jgi:LmbE family N-acetylglucosaminyl deacetylase/ubiquinone/menaquinone biosynthesis C-methylase UbiE